jgi:pimeloyl-ACP methyl ester carboxylesterase
MEVSEVESSGEGLFLGSAAVGLGAICVGTTTALGAGGAALSFLLAACGIERNAESGGRLVPLWKGYLSLVRQGVALLRSAGWTNATSIFGGLFGEPLNAVRAGFQPKHSADAPIQLWGLNPTELPGKEELKSPVMLLAGKLADPGVMAELGRFLAEHELTRDHPIFLCEWGGQTVNTEAREAIWQQMQDVERLYPEPVQWTLIGHSWGGWAAAAAALQGLEVDEKGPRFSEAIRLDLKPNVGKLILMGHPLTAEVSPDKMSSDLLNSLYEIDADWDVLVDQRSAHPDQAHRASIACGHLGLVQLSSAMGRVTLFAA